jgi:hypothetical protein
MLTMAWSSLYVDFPTSVTSAVFSFTSIKTTGLSVLKVDRVVGFRSHVIVVNMLRGALCVSERPLVYHIIGSV